MPFSPIWRREQTIMGGKKISNRFTDNSNSMVLKFLRFSENTRLKSAVEILSAQLLQPITISSMGDGRNSNFTKSPIRNKPFIPHIIFVGWVSCKGIKKASTFFLENKKRWSIGRFSPQKNLCVEFQRDNMMIFICQGKARKNPLPSLSRIAATLVNWLIPNEE